MNHSSKNAPKRNIRPSEKAFSKDESCKPTYEKPILLNLGDIPRGLGQSCNVGSLAMASCVSGGTPKSHCVAGAYPV